MATFQYKGIHSASGRSTKGLVEALDIKDAREKLKRDGVLTQKISQSGGGKTRRGNLFDLATRSHLYRELGAMLHAGLPLDQAMNLLIETPELGDNANVLAMARDKLKEGRPLADALSESSSKVTRFEHSVIEVGERAGTLDSALDKLAEFLEREQTIRDRVKAAMVYPSVVFGFAILVAVAVLGIMLPNFQKLLDKMNVELPFITRAVIAFGDVMRWAGPILLVLLGLAAFWLWKRLESSPSFRAKLNRQLFRVPLVGGAMEALVNLRFSRTLGLLLRGGVPVTEGLSLAGRASGSPWVAELADHESTEVAGGSNLADALARIPPLSGSLPGWVRAGEASGDLPRLLDCAAERYERTWDRKVSRILDLLQPILILIVGGFVLLVALAILLPVLSLNKSIGV